MKQCISCENHRLINDQDLNDSFNYDDIAIVCSLSPNPTQNLVSDWIANRQHMRIVSGGLRPYEVTKIKAPSWCPIAVKHQQNKVQGVVQSVPSQKQDETEMSNQTTGFTASKMRALAEEANKINIEKEIIPKIEIIISTAAREGKTSLVSHFFFSDLKKALRADVALKLKEDDVLDALRVRGFKITHHDDPDPGHPCSTGAYHTIEW